jgi:hypothetical protein
VLRGRHTELRSDPHRGGAARRGEVQDAGVSQQVQGSGGRGEDGGGRGGYRRPEARVGANPARVLGAGDVQVWAVRVLQGLLQQRAGGGEREELQGSDMAGGVGFGRVLRRHCAVPDGDGQGQGADLAGWNLAHHHCCRHLQDVC